MNLWTIVSLLQDATRLAEATVCCMSLRLGADSPVWSIEVIGKIISHAACDTVPLSVVGADSQECSVTGGWIDKTKDQIDTFSPGLIARWESKLFSFFFFKLWALTKLLIQLWPPEYNIPAHLPSWNEQRLCFRSLHSVFQSTPATQFFSRAVYKQEKI